MSEFDVHNQSFTEIESNANDVEVTAKIADLKKRIRTSINKRSSQKRLVTTVLNRISTDGFDPSLAKSELEEISKKLKTIETIDKEINAIYESSDVYDSVSALLDSELDI